MPDCFRALPTIDQEALGIGNNGLTIKRCVPFLDALTTGWIIPLAATVRLEVSGSGSKVDCGWEFDRIEEIAIREHIHRATGVREGWYRTEARAPR